VKEKDPRKNYIIKNPTNLVHFAVAGGAKCLPPLVVFRDTRLLAQNLIDCAKVCLAKIQSIPGKVSFKANQFFSRLFSIPLDFFLIKLNRFFSLLMSNGIAKTSGRKKEI
jgi:hypothetical protein